MSPKFSLIISILLFALSFATGTLLAQAPGSVWHRAEEIKPGVFGQDVGSGAYTFPGDLNVDTGQITAGTKIKVGSSELSSAGLTVNSNSLVVTSTGNVGIGTTGPGYKLDVAGNLRVAGPLVNTAGTSNYTYQDVLHYQNNSSNQTGAMVITVPDGGRTMLNIRITGYDYVSNQGAWEAIIGGYWYTSGDNWINTSAEIRGSAPFRRIRLMKDTASGAPRIVLGETTTVWQGPQFKIDVEVAGYSGQANYTSGWSATLSTDLSALTPLAEPMIKIYVDSSGNVGIGTTSPGQKLEVNGGIRLNTTTAKPPCDSTTRGTLWFTQGTSGAKDAFEVCTKTADDSYAWQTIY